MLTTTPSGPGASSLVGLFNEIGPCSINEDSNATFSNRDSWTNYANLLFIE
jgi:carboxypeptidase C (cathepsin A)